MIDQDKAEIKALIQENIEFFTINHSEEFVSKDYIKLKNRYGNEVLVKKHTQNVEGLWKHIKDIARQVKGIRRQYFQDSLSYFSFRFQNKIYN